MQQPIWKLWSELNLDVALKVMINICSYVGFSGPTTKFTGIDSNLDCLCYLLFLVHKLDDILYCNNFLVHISPPKIWHTVTFWNSWPHIRRVAFCNPFSLFVSLFFLKNWILKIQLNVNKFSDKHCYRQRIIISLLCPMCASYCYCIKISKTFWNACLTSEFCFFYEIIFSVVLCILFVISNDTITIYFSIACQLICQWVWQLKRLNSIAWTNHTRSIYF